MVISGVNAAAIASHHSGMPFFTEVMTLFP